MDMCRRSLALFLMAAAALGAAAFAGRFVFPSGEIETALEEDRCYETSA